MELFKIIELAKKEKQSLIGATIWVNEFDKWYTHTRDFSRELVN